MVQSIDTLVCKPVHGVRLEGKRQQTDKSLHFSKFQFPHKSNGRENLFHRVKSDGWM